MDLEFIVPVPTIQKEENTIDKQELVRKLSEAFPLNQHDLFQEISLRKSNENFPLWDDFSALECTAGRSRKNTMMICSLAK